MMMQLRPFLALLVAGLFLSGCGSAKDKAGKEKGSAEGSEATATGDAGMQEKDVAALIADLQGDNPVVRRAAARQLGDKGAEAVDAVEPLKAALADSEVTVRRAAACALTKVAGMDGADALPVLVEMLGDEANPLSRPEAFEGLGRLGAAAREGGLEPLMGLLTHADLKTRVGAAVTVTQIAGGDVAEALPVLLEGLGQEKAADKQAALGWAISEYGAGGAEALPALTALLKHKDLPTRRTAAHAMARIGGLEAREALEVLVAALKDEDAETRLKYVIILGSLGDGIAEVSVPALLEALQDATPEVSRLAAMTLVNVARDQAGPAVPVLIGALADPDVGNRSLAVAALGDLGPLAAEAAPALAEQLAAEDANLRQNAAIALVQIQGKEAATALPVLIEALGSEDEGLRQKAAFGLVPFGPDAAEAVPALSAMAKAENLDTARTAALVLLHVEGPESAEALRVLGESLKDPDPTTRMLLAQTLGGLGQQAAGLLPNLQETLKDEDVAVRRNAALAITQIAPEKAAVAVPTLAELLKDADAGTREFGAVTLGQLGPVAKAAAGDLAAALADQEVLVQRAAAMALLQIEDAAAANPKAVAVLGAALKDQDVTTRFIFAQTLGELNKQALPLLPNLAAALKDEDQAVRHAAAMSMTQIAPDQAGPAVPTLLELLKDMAPEIRELGATTLGHLGAVAKPAVTGLTTLLKDQAVEVQRSSAYALLKIEGPDHQGAIEILAAALKDPEPATREALAWEMAQFGTLAKNLAPALAELLKDQEVSIRRGAAYSLVKILGWEQAKEATGVLLAALRDPEPSTRAAYLQILNNFPGAFPAEVNAEIEKALKDEDPTVKAEAEALQKKLK